MATELLSRILRANNWQLGRSNWPTEELKRLPHKRSTSIQARVVLDRRNGRGEVVETMILASDIRTRSSALGAVNSARDLYPAARLEIIESM